METQSDVINTKITAIEDKEANEVLDKTIKLSRKAIWIAIVLSLIFPLGGYIYTARWKAFLILLGACAFTGGVGSKNTEEAFKNGQAIGSIIGPIAATIDNGLAINRAKKKIKELT
jgi:hypothetical protein